MKQATRFFRLSALAVFGTVALTAAAVAQNTARVLEYADPQAPVAPESEPLDPAMEAALAALDAA
ncbi:MAG: hypothetical protein AAFN48_09160, partial [Pseudomonadota bacterium]